VPVSVDKYIILNFKRSFRAIEKHCLIVLVFFGGDGLKGFSLSSRFFIDGGVIMFFDVSDVLGYP